MCLNLVNISGESDKIFEPKISVESDLTEQVISM